MRAVTVDDIDFETDVTGAAIRIEKQKTEDNTVVPWTKTAAGNRTVELPNHAAAMLQEYIDRKELEGDAEVFPMSVDTYRRTDVKQAFTRAGVLVEDGSSQVKPTGCATSATPGCENGTRTRRSPATWGMRGQVRVTGAAPG